MNEIREIHENVLQFLLNWRAQHDPGLLFTLRRRPIERLQAGQWFLGNQYYLAFSFWTGKDWVNKTQNIYVEIDINGGFRVRFSAKDDPDKAAILEEASTILGGFIKARHLSYTGNVWTKEYPGDDYLKNLELFLDDEGDKKRIDRLLEVQKKSGGYNPAFERAFNRLNPSIFEESLHTIQQYRSERGEPTYIEPTKPARQLRLLNLELNNLGLFEKCSLEFGERATCLIGENGGGKTTLLRAAAIGLVGTGSPLMNTREEFELQTLLRITGTDEEMRFQYAGKGHISVSYQFRDKLFENGNANLIPLTPQADTGIVEFKEDRIENDGFGLPVGEGGMDADGELPVLVIGYPQRYGKKSDGTDVQKRSPMPNAFDILPLILNTEDNRIDGLKLWISETWNRGQEHQKKVRDLFSIISSMLSREDEDPFIIAVKSAISFRKVIVTTPFNPEGIPFDLLSTGLSNLFSWVGHLISRMYEAYPDVEEPLQEPAIVFVDEIDNYLHPIVQVRAVSVLLEAFPKAQFVFTAHSPVILAATPNEGVKAYRVDNSNIYPIEHFYGRTIQDILLDNYGVEKRASAHIKEEIDKMFRAFNLGNNEEGERIYQELLPILGENDPALEDVQMDTN